MCRGIYKSVQDFLQYCDFKFGRRPTLIPDMPGADNYYDYVGFVLIKVKEGENVQTLG